MEGILFIDTYSEENEIVVYLVQLEDTKELTIEFNNIDIRTLFFIDPIAVSYYYDLKEGCIKELKEKYANNI